ncbi:MAG: hypothetical protein HY820_30165 [Acidobacteria bacterium]|nr:hypothetical protein [Acidobacteriota bacterium]
MSTIIEKVNWGGWRNCYRISNGEVEAVLVADVGPRIIHFGFRDGQNMFYVRTPEIGGAGEPDFKLRGGHRIWTAPEDVPRTYHPDNLPVTVRIDGTVITATAPLEPATGLVKEIEFQLAGEGARASVVHRLTNTLAWEIEFSPWALTMMAAGGTAITGFPPRGTHPEMLAPTHPLVMWAFSDLSDPRWTITRKYLVLRQDPNNAKPAKIGHFNPETWGAYLLGSDLFVKRYTANPALPYPDFGCSYETFTNDFMLELETLGPMTRLKPGATIEHVENWSLHRNVAIPRYDDESLDAVFARL